MSDGPAPADGVPTGVEFTALDPAFRTDPYPVLARLRAREPVHLDGVIKRWVLTRRDDVERVLRDRTMAVDGRKANEGTYMRIFAAPPGGPEPSMLMLDAPDHTRGALVERFPDLRLAGEPLEWRALPAFRGLARLPVLA